jgi:hypothetical protein
VRTLLITGLLAAASAVVARADPPPDGDRLFLGQAFEGLR